MPSVSRNLVAVSLFITFAMLASSCAARNDVPPVEVEKQAFEDLREQIRLAVDSPDRERDAIALINEFEKDLAELRAVVSKRREKMIELNANYDTPRADFDRYMNEISSEITENKRELMDTHRVFRSVLTPDELDAIAKSHTRAMNAAVVTIQAI